jgi:HSP20 family molecular chaperone IbpA
MTFIRPFELDQFDLLWKDLFNASPQFYDITQKITHPVDIFETQDGIRFEIAAVGLNEEDIEILVEGEQLRIRYERTKPIDQEAIIYRGIKRSGFDLSWKISSKFDLSKLEASLDKGLLVLGIPVAEGKAIRKVEIKPLKTLSQKK